MKACMCQLSSLKYITFQYFSIYMQTTLVGIMGHATVMKVLVLTKCYCLPIKEQHQNKDHIKIKEE